VSGHKRITQILLENAIIKILDESRKPEVRQDKKLIANEAAGLFKIVEDQKGKHILELRNEAVTIIKKLPDRDYLILDSALNDHEVQDRLHESGIELKHPERQWESWDWSEDEEKEAAPPKVTPDTEENKENSDENIETDEENNSPKSSPR